MSPNIWYYIYKYKTYFYSMLATVPTVSAVGSANFCVFCCFMVLICCFRLFVSCASVHLFGFTIFIKFCLCRPDLIYWPQWLLHLHYTGARYATVITNWASETKKSRTANCFALELKGLSRLDWKNSWKQVTLARHAKVESFSVFSVRWSWHGRFVKKRVEKS